MILLARPALVLSVAMSTMRLSPAVVAAKPRTLCRYIGRKILSATMEPHPKALAAMAQRAIGSESIERGMSGSGAVASRHTKPTATTRDMANRLRIGNEVQG